MKINPGDLVPEIMAQNIHGGEVRVPDNKAKWVHIQFRRFAGCPICNLHLQSYVKRSGELKDGGIHEIVFFHSPKESLLPYQGNFPFDVIGDPDKIFYKRFGVTTSLMALLNPKVWSTLFKANSEKDKPKGAIEGGPLGLPADFLINPQGKVVACHYGTHAYDQWPVDELLRLARN